MTIPLPKPEVICTHESDLDGLLSGLLLQRLAQKLFGFKPRLEAYHNHNWRQRPLHEKCAWIADMTFDQRLDRPNWVVIDHHATETPPKNAFLVHDLQKSAALLVYDLCREHGLATPGLDRLVHLSNVADLFLENDPDFELATDYASLVKIYQFWNLYELISGEPEKLIGHPLLEVMAVKRRIENPLGYIWSKEHITELSPTVGFVDAIVGNVNLIVHRLLEQEDTPYPVLVTFFRKGNGAVIASFRSRNGQALKVAEKLQGGGHANAAGATLPRSVQNVQDGIMFLRTLLAPPPLRESSLNSLEDAINSAVSRSHAAGSPARAGH